MDAAHGTAVAPSAEHADPGHSADEMKKHVRRYIAVFVALACLTVITVGVSYLKLNRPLAITVALIIASIKAGLVASIFMHLISEKKVIFAVLVLTAFFFILVLVIPSLTIGEGVGVSTG